MASPATLSQRWFRTCPDSSVLPRPRLLARSLIHVSELDDSIGFYERLLGTPADLRMPIPDFGGLELAAVGNLLLIASERPFTPIQRRTSFSLVVPSLTDELAKLDRAGGDVLEPAEDIVPGSRARVSYPDGAVAELVEHRPRPGERAAAPGGTVDTGVRLLARRAVPAADLERAVRFYELALGTTARPRVAPRVPPVTEVAIVGNLLLVGSDRLSDPEAAPVAFALIGDIGDLTESGPIAGARSGLAVHTLANGVRAEVWDKRAFPL